MKVHRPGVREGYDRWAAVYDETPSPLVSLAKYLGRPLLLAIEVWRAEAPS